MLYVSEYIVLIYFRAKKNKTVVILPPLDPMHIPKLVALGDKIKVKQISNSWKSQTNRDRNLTWNTTAGVLCLCRDEWTDRDWTYHCGPPPAASWVTVDDAVLSDPHCHLPKVTIHSLHGNTTEDTQAAWRENKNTDYWYIHRDALSVLLARW